MTINENLAEELFAKNSFCLAWVNHRTGDFAFSRPCSEFPGLFETAEIKLAGRRFEAASADVGISCIRSRFSFRGLSERFCVLDVASNKERGQTELKTSREAELWLRHLIQVLPEKINDVRKQFAPAIYARTSEARSACQHYLRHIGFPCSAKDAIRNLKASEEQAIEANLILSHEVGWLANQTFHYAAVLAILCLYKQVEPKVEFQFQDPRKDIPLMWRIQIIADRLMAHPKQMTLVFPGDSGLQYSFREPLCGRK
jgi:hypothetical protein